MILLLFHLHFDIFLLPSKNQDFHLNALFLEIPFSEFKKRWLDFRSGRSRTSDDHLVRGHKILSASNSCLNAGRQVSHFKRAFNPDLHILISFLVKDEIADVFWFPSRHIIRARTATQKCFIVKWQRSGSRGSDRRFDGFDCRWPDFFLDSKFENGEWQDFGDEVDLGRRWYGTLRNSLWKVFKLIIIFHLHIMDTWIFCPNS